MNFELNLIENSYDYIKETLYYYKKIGYGESHDEDRNSIEEKRKWKTEPAAGKIHQIDKPDFKG